MTPAAIEQVLTDFRSWLTELAALPEPADAVETIDLHAVVGQFTRRSPRLGISAVVLVALRLRDRAVGARRRAAGTAVYSSFASRIMTANGDDGALVRKSDTECDDHRPPKILTMLPAPAEMT